MNRAELCWLLGKLALGHAVLFAAIVRLNLTERARRRSYWRLRAAHVEQLSRADSRAL